RQIVMVGAHMCHVYVSGQSLVAFNLTRDCLPHIGTVAHRARRLGLDVNGTGGDRDLVWHGRLEAPTDAAAFGRRLARRLGQRPLAVGALDRRIERVAWCTGAAQDYLEDAIALGADAFVSGEISERTTHVAR